MSRFSKKYVDVPKRHLLPQKSLRRSILLLGLLALVVVAGVCLSGHFQQIRYGYAQVIPPNQSAPMTAQVSYRQNWWGTTIDKIYFQNPPGYLVMNPNRSKSANARSDGRSAALWQITLTNQLLSYDDIRALPFTPLPQYAYLALVKTDAHAWYDPLGQMAHLNPLCTFIRQKDTLIEFTLRPETEQDIKFCPYCAYD